MTDDIIPGRTYLATIGWTGAGAQPWQEYLHGESAEACAESRREELDRLYPDKSPHMVRCEPDPDFLGVDPAASDERSSFRWAVANQGFDGDFAAWQSLSADDRAEYEAGAAGIPTA